MSDASMTCQARSMSPGFGLNVRTEATSSRTAGRSARGRWGRSGAGRTPRIGRPEYASPREGRRPPPDASSARGERPVDRVLGDPGVLVEPVGLGGHVAQLLLDRRPGRLDLLVAGLALRGGLAVPDTELGDRAVEVGHVALDGRLQGRHV